MVKRDQVLSMVDEERARQVETYGSNADLALGFRDDAGVTRPWLTPYTARDNRTIEEDLRADYDDYESIHGKPTWMHLIREEVAELFASNSKENTVEEAIQVAALCVSLVEHLLNRGKGLEGVLSDRGARLIALAYDDGKDGPQISPGEGPWFIGRYRGRVIFFGVEKGDDLFLVVPANGHGAYSVVHIEAMLNNELGVVFPSVEEARAYARGLIAK